MTREDTTVRELKEACRMAVSALLAQHTPDKLDRDAWELCYRCQSNRILDNRFCCRCGRPLTEGAWVELEHRIGGKTT